MACDRKTLLMISCYADGEATREEAARSLEHLNKCPECRKMVSEWEEQRQVLDWAYTLELPEITFDQERQSMTNVVLRERSGTWSSIWRRKWVVPLAFAAVLFAAALVWVAVTPPLMGARLATGSGARSVRVDWQVRLRVGPNSTVTRINDGAIKLEKGWVEASVRHGTGFEIISKRMRVTDQGTRFRVDTGTKGDVVTVDEGSVDVSIGTDSHRVVAGRAFLAMNGEKPLLISPPTVTKRDDSEEKGNPISGRDRTFTPRSPEDMAWDDGLQSLALRFSHLTTGDGRGRMTASDKGIGAFIADTGLIGLRDGFREHTGDIARVLAGGKPDGSWEIPVRVMQVPDLTAPVSLTSDTYYVRLALTSGRLVWRLTGAKGGTAELPVLWEKTDRSSCNPSDELSDPTGWLDQVETPARQSGWETGWRVLNWPGRLKPTVRFTLRTSPVSQMEPERSSALAELARQIEGVDGFKVENGVSELGGELTCFDPQRKNWLFHVWNRNAGKQFAQAWLLGASGRPAKAALAAINTNVPLADQGLSRGVYVIWWVHPVGSGDPFVEISTPDGKRRVRLPGWDKNDTHWSRCTEPQRDSGIPGLGNWSLKYGIKEPRNDASSYAFIIGAAGGWSSEDEPSLGNGWIKIPKP